MDTVFGIQYNGGGKRSILRTMFPSLLDAADRLSKLVFCFRSKTPPRTTKVILATDQGNARSILIYQKNIDKIKQLTSHSAMGVSGPNCDMVKFTEYVLAATCFLRQTWTHPRPCW